MLNNSYTFPQWSSAQNYSKFSFFQNLLIGGVSYASSPYWSTTSNNINQNPSGQFIFPITSYSRTAGVATINFTNSGGGQAFNPGSFFAITGIPTSTDATFNYTGMALNGNPTSLTFTSVGPDVSYSATGAINAPNTFWTTGFFWQPTYSTTLDITQSTFNAKFSDGFEQRAPAGLNSNLSTWNLTFIDRSDTEVAGLLCFVQNLGAVYSTPILLNTPILYNSPRLKYILGQPKLTSKSFGLYDVTLSARQVFEA